MFHLESRTVSLSDELSQSRTDFEAQTSRLQTKLAQAQGEIQKLRRKTAVEHLAETARLQGALELAQEGCDLLRREKDAAIADHAVQVEDFARRNAALRREFNTEKVALREEIKDIKSQWKKEVTEITSQRDDLRRLCLEHQTQTLAIHAHYTNIETDVQSTRQELSSVKDQARLLEASRDNTLQTLLFGLLVLWRFSHVLGLRLSDALRVKAVLLLRFKKLSKQKVEARRECLRVQNLNQDLQALLDAQTTKCIEESASSQKWHAEYYKSVKARDRAAAKFKTFQRFAVQRFSSTATKLLTALLILWRQNTILSAHLAETQALARALQMSAVEADETQAAAAPDDEAFQAENLHPQGFSMLSRDEANAVYTIQYRKYSQALRDYQQFVESCSTPAYVDDSVKLALQESYDGLKDLHEKVVLERDDALATLETLKAEHRDLQVRFTHASKEHRAAIHEMEDAQAVVRTKDEEYRVQSSAAADALVKNQERVEALQQQCASKDQMLQELEAKLVDVEEKYLTVDSTATSLQITLKALREEHLEFQERNGIMQQQLAEAIVKFQANEALMLERQDKTTALHNELVEYGRRVDAQLLDTRKKLQASISEAGGLQDRIAGLEDIRRSLEGRTVELEKEVVDVRAKHRHAQTVIDQMKTQQTQQQQQVRRMDKAALEVNSQLFDARKRAQDLTKVVADLERKHSELVEELDASKDATMEVQSQLETRLEDLRKEVSASKNSAKQMQSQLQSELNSQLQDSSKTEASFAVTVAILHAAQKENRARWVDIASKARSMDQHIGRLTRTFEHLSSLDGYYRRLLVKNTHIPQVDLTRAPIAPASQSAPIPVPVRFAPAPPPVHIAPLAPSKLTPVPASLKSASVPVPPKSAYSTAYKFMRTPVLPATPALLSRAGSSGLQGSSTPRKRRRGGRGSGITRRATSGGIVLSTMSKIVKTPKLSSSASSTVNTPTIGSAEGSSKQLHVPMSRRARRRAATADAAILQPAPAATTLKTQAVQSTASQKQVVVKTTVTPVKPETSTSAANPTASAARARAPASITPALATLPQGNTVTPFPAQGPVQDSQSTQAQSAAPSQTIAQSMIERASPMKSPVMSEIQPVLCQPVPTPTPTPQTVVRVQRTPAPTQRRAAPRPAPSLSSLPDE